MAKNKKAKLDLIISLMRKDLERTRRKGYSHSSVLNPELEMLLEWAARVREKNPFLVGDRVKLATTGDPDDAPEPKEGVVVGFAGPNAVLVSSGEYHSLYYQFDDVERIED